jgi:hypothetical protein
VIEEAAVARVVVIGDIGGHPDQLRVALVGVGAEGEPLRLPSDVTVVQVGDLIDRGPDSSGVLTLVRGLLERQPAQWVQLAGNHEGQYLPGGSRFWEESMAAADVALLASWWERGLMNVAAAVRSGDGDELLITHAGLTVGAWQALGEPMTATSAAWLLNQRPPVIWHGGEAAVNRSAGPLWAEAGWELHEPWLEYHASGELVPFGQIHGHSALVRYADQTWRAPGRVRQRASVDWAARQVRVRVGGRVFVGVDPKHGRHGAPAWQPLVLDEAEVISGVGVAP